MAGFLLPTGSAIPGTLAAFMSLAETALPEGSTVYFGSELGAYSTPHTLQITEISGDQEPAEIGGRYRRDETFQLVCLLTYYNGGIANFPAALDTVMADFQSLAVAVSANPSLTGALDPDGSTVQVARYCEVGNFIITPQTDAKGLSAVTLSFALRCVQRVETQA